jgi:hypothetical protein
MAVSTTTPTAEQVAVPETLLKKRRSTEKSREEKLAKAAEAQKVSTDRDIVEEGGGTSGVMEDGVGGSGEGESGRPGIREKSPSRPTWFTVSTLRLPSTSTSFLIPFNPSSRPSNSISTNLATRNQTTQAKRERHARPKTG